MSGAKRSDRNLPLLALAAGTLAGLGVGAVAGYVDARRRRGRAPGLTRRGPNAVAQRVAETLATDAVLRHRAVQVEALADGIVELTGAVRTEEEAERALGLAEGSPGVRTVLNRLDVGILERQLEENRARYRSGDARYHATRWSGMGVGTGMRRQARETDPDRPDDRVPLMEHSLGVDRAEEALSERIDKIAPAVEGGTTANAAPTDRYDAEDASHRRLGNVPEEPIQALNPASGVHENVKKGTRLTLEESGVEREREASEARRSRSEREAEERS
ncbi:MAG: BON domain-containing protein [Gemmatimonadota bacterium]